MTSLGDDELEMARDFIENLTGESPLLLSRHQTATSSVSFEISRWSNTRRKLYIGFEIEMSYAWLYILHAYGMKFHLYISKLPVTVKELMDDEYLYDELVDEGGSSREAGAGIRAYETFERSMIMMQ